jgi:RNA polymerase sigma-70 factor (ECF subfamily)
MNQAEFHALYERHSRDVHRFAFYLSGQRAQAEDICAETFMRAWCARDRIRTETVKAYLFSIARNLVREGHRRRAASSDELDQLPEAGPGPAAQAGDRIELGSVLRALQDLRETDRAALLMRVDGVSHEEIARALEISVGAVRVKIHRARLQLGELKLREERKS